MQDEGQVLGSCGYLAIRNPTEISIAGTDTG